MSTATTSPAKPAVVRVFVDFWNFHLSVQRCPAVEHLTQKGLQVIHAGVAARPSRLARTCSASLDLSGLLRSIERADSGAAIVRAAGAHATAAARSTLADTKEEPTKKSCPSGSQNQSHRGLPG